jgi:hypothetical protein
MRGGEKCAQIIVWVCREGIQGEKGQLCVIYMISPSVTFWNTTITSIEEYLYTVFSAFTSRLPAINRASMFLCDIYIFTP